MANYRQVHKGFWVHPDIQDLSPKQKLIFLYLCTNGYIGESGIFKIGLRSIAADTGIAPAEVEESFAAGIKNLHYDYTTNVCFVVNFRRYQGGGNPNNVALAIAKEARNTASWLWLYFVRLYPEYSAFLEPIISAMPGLPIQTVEGLEGFLQEIIEENGKGFGTVGKPFYSTSNSISNRNSVLPKITTYKDMIDQFFKSGKIEEYRAEFMIAYPGIDWADNIRRARMWLITNPGKRYNIPEFLNNWFNKGARDSARFNITAPVEIGQKKFTAAVKKYEELRADAEARGAAYTDAVILGYMYNTLKYPEPVITEVIDYLGGPGALSGVFTDRYRGKYSKKHYKSDIPQALERAVIEESEGEPLSRDEIKAIINKKFPEITGANDVTQSGVKNEKAK